MKLRQFLNHALTSLVILSHLALTIVDVLGVVKLADFLVRMDGSQMDPQAMLPIEELFVAMLALPFGIIVIGFLFLNKFDAAMLSVAIHILYGAHQIWKKQVWDAAMHPDSNLIRTEFFIVTHVVWAGVSGIIAALERHTIVENKVKVW